MPKLPILSASVILRALGRVGYEFDHQKGDHLILRNKLPPFRRIVVPNRKEVPRGTVEK
jgi:predicted RNA binding protein YcfA (HicA-like mRNA interferase family)